MLDAAVVLVVFGIKNLRARAECCGDDEGIVESILGCGFDLEGSLPDAEIWINAAVRFE
jgi:hypothetical protein